MARARAHAAPAASVELVREFGRRAGRDGVATIAMPPAARCASISGRRAASPSASSEAVGSSSSQIGRAARPAAGPAPAAASARPRVAGRKIVEAAEADALQRGVDGIAGAAVEAAAQKCEVLAHASARGLHRVEMADDSGKLPAARLGRRRSRRNLPGVRPQQPGQRPQQARFAGAVRPARPAALARGRARRSGRRTQPRRRARQPRSIGEAEPHGIWLRFCAS